MGTRQLVLAFDWATSNADRLPATVLLARRFLETERDLQRAPYAANFDAAAPVPLPGVTLAPGETLALEFQPLGGAAPSAPETRVIPFAETADVRAPGRSGFFTLRRADEALVRGAAQFADTRLGDFRAAETFFADVESERAAAVERNTTADPFANAWLAALALLVLASWWVRQSAMSQAEAGGTSSAKSAAENQPVEAALR